MNQLSSDTLGLSSVAFGTSPLLWAIFSTVILSQKKFVCLSTMNFLKKEKKKKRRNWRTLDTTIRMNHRLQKLQNQMRSLSNHSKIQNIFVSVFVSTLLRSHNYRAIFNCFWFFFSIYLYTKHMKKLTIHCSHNLFKTSVFLTENFFLSSNALYFGHIKSYSCSLVWLQSD